MMERVSDRTAEPYTGYYYANGERIPLIPEPRVFATRFRTGRGSRDPRFSPSAYRILREESRNIGFVPHYGLQIYEVQPNTVRAKMKPEDQTEEFLREVRALNQESPVEFATPAYHRTIRKTAQDAPDLMFVTTEFVVQFRPEVGTERIREYNEQFGVRIVSQLAYAANGYVLEAPMAVGERDAVTLSNIYYESGLVIFAHPNFIRRRYLRKVGTADAVATPAEGETATDGRARSEFAGDLVVEREDRAAFLSQQWHLSVAKVTDAWTLTRGTGSVTIAILDDGVDTGHAEFAGKIVGQFDFATNQANAEPKSSSDSHGTACAGVAVARGVKALGAAPNCSMLAVRTPDFLGVTEEADMFRWVADQGADIISCSWGPADGTGQFDPLVDNVRSAIRYCLTNGRGGNGIPIFWAAGNGDESVSLDGYASNPDVMAVAASSSNERRSWYSDFGPEIFICAPSSGDGSLGERRIFTTDRRGNLGYNPDPDTGASHPASDLDYTDDFGGTSSSTPLVAGIAGLLLSVNSSLTRNQVRDILLRTADKIGTAADYDHNGHSQLYGYGRVNAMRAVQEAMSGGQPASSTPSITGPATLSSSAGPPVFQINLGGRSLYAVEVATDFIYFDADTHGSGRNSSNFYGSWSDMPLFSNPTYALPAPIWNNLRNSARLYYRVHVANDNNWSNWAVSTPDTQAASAPSILLTSGQSGGSPTSGGTTPSSSITYPSGAVFQTVSSPQDSVDYSDQVGNGIVPLIEVRNRMSEKLATNFVVSELAASDGARYARISKDLVAGLQRIRTRVGAAVKVHSGYRHPALNRAVGGVANSQHIAGRAADISTTSLAPLQLARIALEELGGNIGIGLGRNTIHVDLRGTLATWVYEGAELGESQFDAWVLDQLQRLGFRREARYEVSTRTGLSIIGPERYRVDGPPIAFLVETGANPYYAIEIAADDPLLLTPEYAGERTLETFFASWAEDGLQEAKEEVVYTLAESVWKRLRTARNLYYRLLTTSQADPSWPDYEVTTPDSQVRDAPYVELVGGPAPRVEPVAPNWLIPVDKRRAEENFWRRG